MTSRPSGLVRSSDNMRVPAFVLWKIADLSGDSSPPMKGRIVRQTSKRVDDSTRTTVAPKSASVRVAPGPAKAHIRDLIRVGPRSGVQTLDKRQ